MLLGTQKKFKDIEDVLLNCTFKEDTLTLVCYARYCFMFKEHILDVYEKFINDCEKELISRGLSKNILKGLK